MAIKGGFYRSVLAQMIIAGFIALLGPGLWVCMSSSTASRDETTDRLGRMPTTH